VSSVLLDSERERIQHAMRTSEQMSASFGGRKISSNLSDVIKRPTLTDQSAPAPFSWKEGSGYPSLKTPFAAARISFHKGVAARGRQQGRLSTFRFRRGSTADNSEISSSVEYPFLEYPESMRYTIRRSARPATCCGFRRPAATTTIRLQLKPDPQRAPTFVPIEVPPKVIVAARRRHTTLPNLLEE